MALAMHTFLKGALAVLLPLITKEFSLSYTEAGIVVTLSLVAYALIQLPAGYLATKVGSKKIIVLGIALGSASTSLLAFSDYYGFCILLVLGQIGTGFHLGVATALISNLFEEKEMGKAIGTHESAVSVGALISPLVILPMALSLNWRLTYLICGSFGFAVTLAVWRMLPNVENSKTERISEHRPTRELLNKQILLIISVMMIWALVHQAILAFLPLYLTVEKNIPLSSLAYYVSVPNALGILGRPIGGQISDKLGRKRTALISLALLLMGAILTILIYEIRWLLPVLALLGFGLHTNHPVMLAFLMSKFSPSRRAIIMGRVNSIRLTVAAFGPAIVGAVADSIGFRGAFSILAICILVSLLGATRLQEKR